SGKAADAAWDAAFDLATMTSNAFQCLITDAELRASLAAIHASLRDGGRFLFGTRHPQDRAWERWNPSRAYDVQDLAGRPLRMWPGGGWAAGGGVRMPERTAERGGTVLRVDGGQWRFPDVDALNKFLDGAGFPVEEQYGDWRRAPPPAASREIVTVARRG